MKDFNEMNKMELRAACKEAGIKNYGKMNNAGMREALEAHHAPAVVEAAEVSAKEEVKVEQVAPAIVERNNGEEDVDPRDLAQCPECGSDELFAGMCNEGGIVILEEVVGGCHRCDWEYDIRKSAKAASPVGKGIKIEKDREERNGVKRPSIGGACRMVWDYLDSVVAAGAQPILKQVKAHALEQGWNQNNAAIEFYQWRKFNGIRGRQPKA